MKSYSQNEELRFTRITKPFLLMCLLLSLTLGLFVRLPYFLKYDFALNDGALFVEMSNAIRLNNFILPATVSYNKVELPFAYPPLSFYIVACLTTFFNLEVLDVVRYLPLFFNVVSIGIFVILASQLLKNKAVLLYTSLFFPLIPRSYEWLIMGGGVTRSVGFFFALLAIYQGNRISIKKDIKPFIYCSLFLSMALLSHLEWGITSFITVSLLVLYKQLSKRAVILIFILGALVLAITSPWWVTVTIRHGLTPFLAASKTSEWQPGTLLTSIVSILKIFDDGLGGFPISALAILGWLLSVVRKDWFLPVWLVAIFLTTPRHGPTPAAMPLAMLAAIGLEHCLIPILLSLVAALSNNRSLMRVSRSKLLGNNTVVGQTSTNHVAIASIATVLAILTLTKISYVQRTPLVALTESERNAMQWIKKHTSAAAEFVVLTNSISWQDDRVAEWFPVLADRKSLTTAQGLEWIPGSVFRSKVEEILELKRYQAVDNHGLAKHIASRYADFQYVAVFIPYVEPTYGKLLESGKYKVVYARDAVLVFEKM